MEDRDSIQEEVYETSTTSAPPSTPIYRTGNPQLPDGRFSNRESFMKAPFGGSGFILPSLEVPSVGKPFAADVIGGKSSSVTFADTFGPGSDRKRSRRVMYEEGTLDEIMGQITNKLTNLSTSSNSQQDSIMAFLEVLGCSDAEAAFYLESSAWNIQTAVELFLENNPHPATSLGRFYSPIPALTTIKSANTKYQWRERDVIIDGLPRDWVARVSAVDGTIYFIQTRTGHTQKNVPPGFADIAEELFHSNLKDSPVAEDRMEDDNHHENEQQQQLQHVFGTDSEYFRQHQQQQQQQHEQDDEAVMDQEEADEEDEHGRGDDEDTQEFHDDIL